MLTFDDMLVEAITARSLVVSWSFRPTLELVATYRVDVSRSLSPEGEFEVIATALRANQYVYLDHDPPELSKWATLYYKVRAYLVDAAGVEIPATSSESDAKRVRSEVSAYGLAIIEARELHFRYLEIGRPSLIYRRRTSGETCPNCYDKVEERVKEHDCPLCFGTGRLGGYFPPIQVLIQFKPALRRNNVEGTIREIVYVDAAMGHFPLVSPRDVIYEIGNGKRYLVNQIATREHLRTVVMQQLVLLEFGPQSKENDLPQPEQMASDAHTSYLVSVT